MEKEIRARRKKVSLFWKIMIFILIFQVCLTLFQHSRYVLSEDEDNYYCCWHMSRDCEHFFESLGFRVYQVRGSREVSGPEGDVESSHRWILVDFGFASIPFESTALCFFDPTWLGFHDFEISEGYCIDGKYYVDGEFEWNDWN